jgi:CRISPR-associated endonuclease/helicase Cas3
MTLSSAPEADYAKKLAVLIVEKHRAGTLTLVVVNRVGRAQAIYEALRTPEKGSNHPLYDPARVALIHSRFRREDRKQHERLLFSDGDRIVIATQAVEAGVDVSARLLVTELAPWSSLVQRIGRCNRRAEYSDAEVLWVDIELDGTEDLLRPYSKPELGQAKTALASLSEASPRSLSAIKVAESPVIRPVIRRRDLVDLFDTTPDLCGQDLDISRYVRDSDDNDLQFFWRLLGEDGPSPDEKPPGHEELCRVSIGEAAKFLRKKPRAWRWNPLEEKWEGVAAARPGSIYLVAADAGGYNDALGWTGAPKDKPTPCPSSAGALERYAGNRLSLGRAWQTIAAHTAQVLDETASITAALALSPKETAALRTAAHWHDIGKAHPDFQEMLIHGDAQRGSELWAKSAKATGRCERHFFRHELASALAWLVQSPPGAAERDLVAYLIAAHHGKVRLSIRSLPEEKGDPQDAERLFARGIWQGDKLPAIQVGGLVISETTLDLSFMQLGEGPQGPSWLARTIALRDRLGPFRLAFLETLLRAADARASAPELQAKG